MASNVASLRRFRWLQLGAAGLLAGGVAGILAFDALRSPDAPFLARDGTPWIVAQTPLQTHGMRIDHAQPPTSLFELRFRVIDLPPTATLRVRALREVSLRLNGEPVHLGDHDPGRWKEATTVDVTSALVAGDNVLFARVTNPNGNPALQLRLDGLDWPLQTDATWLAAWEGDPVAYAALANDALRHPEGAALPAPLASLAARAVPLGMLGAIGCALFLGLRARPRAAQWAPAVALGAVTLFWIALFAKVVTMPLEVGFDADAHLAYVRWLLAKRALPAASDGAAMYHPPLFHALSALVLAAVGPDGIAARVGLAAVPMLSGLGLAFVARGMARVLIPGAPWPAAGAVLAAGLLPMSLTLAACVSNEAPHALLASLAVLATLRALVRERVTLRDDLAVGVLLAAAVLTKYSSVVLVPILVGALAAKRVAVEREPAARTFARAALGLGSVLLFAGWFYLRQYLVSGSPLVTNLNGTPGEAWWQLPGFHTSAYFLGFGDALTQPWFSSFHSLWDALYTTLWGDGLLSGATSPALAPRRWRYDWMAAGYLLALPATALLAVGWGRAAQLALRGAELGRRLAWSLVVLLPVVFLASFVQVSLRYPFWSVGKAFYALLLTPTLGLLGVLGFDALDRVLARHAPLVLRALPFGWAAAFGGAIAWAYVG